MSPLPATCLDAKRPAGSKTPSLIGVDEAKTRVIISNNLPPLPLTATSPPLLPHWWFHPKKSHHFWSPLALLKARSSPYTKALWSPFTPLSICLLNWCRPSVFFFRYSFCSDLALWVSCSIACSESRKLCYGFCLLVLFFDWMLYVWTCEWGVSIGCVVVRLLVKYSFFSLHSV